MTLAWPTTPGALMVWAQLLLVWVIALYYAGRTTSIWGRTSHTPSPNWFKRALPRLATLVIGPLVLFGGSWGRAIALSIVGVALGSMLLWARDRGREEWRKFGAEFELGLTIVFVMLSALISGDSVLSPRISIIHVPMSEDHIASLTFTAAIVGFLIHGGTQVVRAVLNKADASQPDEAEYNRGRLIGSIERVLLLAMVATGNWAALGFTIAAKSLVRSKEFDDRNFAEYFLIGTLTSTALAIVAGGLVRLVFVALW